MSAVSELLDILSSSASESLSTRCAASVSAHLKQESPFCPLDGSRMSYSLDRDSAEESIWLCDHKNHGWRVVLDDPANPEFISLKLVQI